MKLFLTAVFALFFAFSSVAQKMPDFHFLSTDDAAVSTKDIARGKALMLVYFRSDCDHCMHTAQQLKAAATKYP